MHEKLKRAAYCLTVATSPPYFDSGATSALGQQEIDWTDEDVFERKDLPSSLRTSDFQTLSRPLFCADASTLGERKTAQITEMNLCAFEKACVEFLNKISGPAMRDYYGSLARGELQSFEACTRSPQDKSLADPKGIDANKLDRLRHFLASLNSVKSEGSLKRPNLLRAVARILGDNLEPPASFVLLERAAIERARTIGNALAQWGPIMGPQCKGPHATRIVELKALEGLVASIYRALTDEGTMKMLAPVPTVQQRLRIASTSMGSLVYTGVSTLAGKTALYLQGADNDCEHDSTHSP